MFSKNTLINKLLNILKNNSIEDYKPRIFNILKDYGSEELIQIAQEHNITDRQSALELIVKIMEHMNGYEGKIHADHFRPKKTNYDEVYEIKNLLSKLQSENKSLIDELKKTKNRENSEIENLRAKISTLQSTLNKEMQKKVETNFSNYVKKATATLRARERLLNQKSITWGNISSISLVIAALFATISLCWGYYEYSTLASDKITWLWATYGVMKGGFIIAMLCTLATYAYSLSKAYTHESLKLGDRSHAIKLGEVFLQIYGSQIDPEEFKNIFENWNLNGSSAFYSSKASQETSSLDKDSVKKIVEELLPSQIIKNIESITSIYRK
ncbi:hypothetical protein ACRQTN_06330 [Pectobacterium brasiliense]|uniref:hypothetical protein n=1 Tax=Pectobacterium brasiliense TaxID=180957 RepID=UPI00068C9903|nr:hypothetical protein [Pectobacterium brasiliense]GKV79193.1 hypothetical protein PEC106568_43660 [Pectobacterium carotovorum subsp. carotovorum]